LYNPSWNSGQYHVNRLITCYLKQLLYIFTTKYFKVPKLAFDQVKYTSTLHEN